MARASLKISSFGGPDGEPIQGRVSPLYRANGAAHWIGPAFAVVPYEPAHLRAMAIQPAQAHLRPLIADRYAEKVARVGPAWTALVHGTPVCCAGFEEWWEGRAVAWAVVGDGGSEMLRVTRAVRQALDRHPAARVEANVEVGFEPGERWARLLGFRCEARFERFCRGRDYWHFVRLRNAL